MATLAWLASDLPEINPEDAAERDINNGDLLSIQSDNVLDQLGRPHTGGFTAVAYISDIVPPGVTFTYFLFPGSPSNNVTSADSSLQPVNLRYNFKMGKGSITNLGPSGLADTMSFAPLNLAPAGEAEG